MHRKFVMSVFIFLFVLKGEAQQSWTMEQLIEKAVVNYPATKQKDYVRSLGKVNEKSIQQNEYPQVSITGQATYQSEVTKFDFPGIEGPKPDNYNIGLDLRYPLTEFDILKSKKELEQQKTELNIHQIDADLQRVREQVTTIYGNILLQKENRRILLVRISDLQSQKKKIESAVANGALLKTNQLVLESEILSTEQKIADIDGTIEGLVQQLSLLTGLTIASDSEFVLPAAEIVLSKTVRPELQVFQSQLTLLTMQDKLLKKENRAKLYVFGQGFYGRPGYNFLNNNFRVYGTAGIGINWNINNMATQKTKQKAIEINKQIVQQQQSAFELNLQSALVQKQTEITKYQTIISKDNEIVNKRKEILKVASSQLQNGAITSTEYITELNAENAAELNLLLHQVQRALAKVQYNTLAGY